VPLTACAGSSEPGDGTAEPTGGSAGGGALTYVLTGDPGTLNPYLTTIGEGYELSLHIYGRLIEATPEGQLLPQLAESWVNPSTTSATFTLREGLTCSDGTPLTASDVGAAIEWVGNPDNGSTRLGLLVQAGTTVQADDAARTVEVTSGAPDPFLVTNIGLLPIVCRAGLEDQSLLDQGSLSTGPYTMTEIVPGDHYTMTLREDYVGGAGDWTPQTAGVPKTVTARVVTNETTSANLLLEGEVNLAGITGADISRLMDAGLTSYAEYSQAFIFMNQLEGHAGQDKLVREALFSAMNLTEMGAVLTAGAGQPPTNLNDYTGNNVCPGDTVSGNLPAFDVEKAKSLLDQAGWLAGDDGTRQKDGPPRSLVIAFRPTAPTAEATVELAQSQLKEIGVEVETRATTDPNATFVSGDWDIAALGIGVYNPAQMAPLLGGESIVNGGPSITSNTNQDFLKYAAEAAALPSSEGCEAWLKADEALIKNLDFLPLVKVPTLTFANGVTLEGGWHDPYTVRVTG
jgi:peptide/nickel transport system substrate-binding protein